MILAQASRDVQRTPSDAPQFSKCNGDDRNPEELFLRLCFGRAVFVISGKIYFDVKMNFLPEA